MSDHLVETLLEAIARNSAAVLTVPSVGGIARHHKTRFLGNAGEGVWIDAGQADSAQINELIASGQVVGMSFRGGVNRIVFTTSILRLDNNFQISESVVTAALLVAQPFDLKAVQRRGTYRVPVRTEDGLSLRMWSLAEHVYLKDRPLAAQRINATLKNLSLGGIGVWLERGPERPLPAGFRLRLELKDAAGPNCELLLEGRVRHVSRPLSGSGMGCYLGIQFARMENHIEGRQQQAELTAIIGRLHREEVKRRHDDAA